MLVVGSFLRKDHPLFAPAPAPGARKKGAKVMSLHALRDDWLMPMGTSLAVAPSGWAQALADIAAAIGAAKGVAAPAQGNPNDAAKAIAAIAASGERKAILLGNAAAQHPDAAEIVLAWPTGSPSRPAPRVGYLVEGANTVGAQLVGALPGEGGAERRRSMLGARRRSRPASC